MDHLCYICIVFVMLSRLFSDALWSPDGKGLTYWLSFVVLDFVCVTFLCCILCQVWYLIVSIADLCSLLFLPYYKGLFLKEIISYHREEILPLKRSPHLRKRTQLVKITTHFSNSPLKCITFQLVATPLSYCTFSFI